MLERKSWTSYRLSENEHIILMKSVLPFMKFISLYKVGKPFCLPYWVKY